MAATTDMQVIHLKIMKWQRHNFNISRNTSAFADYNVVISSTTRLPEFIICFGVGILHLEIGLKNWRQFVIQSEVKTQTNGVILSHRCPRAYWIVSV